MAGLLKRFIDDNIWVFGEQLSELTNCRLYKVFKAAMSNPRSACSPVEGFVWPS